MDEKHERNNKTDSWICFLFLSCADQKGDGRTFLNEKYGYWNRQMEMQSAVNVYEVMSESYGHSIIWNRDLGRAWL